MGIYIIIFTCFIILCLFYIVLLYFKYKIGKLEKQIQKAFLKRNSIIPSLYHISENYIVKHDNVFKEINMIYKKYVYSRKEELYSEIEINTIIHNEFNFIFTICSKQNKLQKNWKYIYISEFLGAENEKIQFLIQTYKTLYSTFNRLIHIKNRTIIGYLFPLKKIQGL